MNILIAKDVSMSQKKQISMKIQRDSF